MNAVKMILIFVLSLFAICGAVMPRIEVDGSGGIDVFEERVEMNEDYYSNRLGDDLDSVELTLDEMSGSIGGLASGNGTAETIPQFVQSIGSRALSKNTMKSNMWNTILIGACRSRSWSTKCCPS